jgi:hypothetical protein
MQSQCWKQAIPDFSVFQHASMVYGHGMQLLAALVSLAARSDPRADDCSFQSLCDVRDTTRAAGGLRSGGPEAATKSSSR